MFDGHAGSACAEFLRENYIRVYSEERKKSQIEPALHSTFGRLEQEWKDLEGADDSGSCAVVVHMEDSEIVVANVGGTRRGYPLALHVSP